MNAILIQSRLSSSRFPKKMLKKLEGISLVEYVYSRCKNSKRADVVTVITSDEKSDDALVELCNRRNIPVFRGSLDNVLDRFVKVASVIKADRVCRVCGDSPFVDVDLIDQLFDVVYRDNLEFATVTNCLNGFLSEVMPTETLIRVQNMTQSTDDMEHVTRYIRNNLEKFKYKCMDVNLRPEELSQYTLTVDYPKDLELVKKIASKLNGFDFDSKDVIKIMKEIDNEI